jgi:hypothetical protein
LAGRGRETALSTATVAVSWDVKMLVFKSKYVNEHGEDWVFDMTTDQKNLETK